MIRLENGLERNKKVYLSFRRMFRVSQGELKIKHSADNGKGAITLEWLI